MTHATLDRVVVATGKKKYMLSEFDPFMAHMERILGYSNVTATRFHARSKSSKPVYNIQYYDGSTQEMKVSVRGRTGKQEFKLRVPEEKEKLVRLIVDTYHYNPFSQTH